MKRDDRGLSLVEMIIVVAILSVIVGMAGLGFGMVNGKPADKCARNLKSVLQAARVTAQGKYDAWWEIYMDAATGNILVQEHVQVREGEEIPKDPVVISDRDVCFEYAADAHSTYTELAPGTSLEVRFSRSSGALTGPYAAFRIRRAGNVRKVNIDPVTGRVTLE